jgi:hypothetical protein
VGVYTLLSGVSAPSLVSDANPYTFGIQFKVTQSNCKLTAVWFYSPSGAAQLPYAVGLYNADTSTFIYSDNTAGWSGAAGSGWVKWTLPSSQSLTSGTNYIATVVTSNNSNWYGRTQSYFSSGAGASGLTNGPLTCPNNASAVHGQMCWHAGVSMTLPVTQTNASILYVDPEITQGTSITVTGVGATATDAGGIGSVTKNTGVHVTGVGATATDAGGIGTTKIGDRITGLAAHITATGQSGTVKAGTGIHVPGVNVNAIVDVEGGIGRGHVGLSIPGVAAQAIFNPGTGIEHSGAGQRVPGVAASIVVAGGHGITFYEAIITGVAAHALVAVRGLPIAGSVIAGNSSNIIATVLTTTPRLLPGNPNPRSILDSVKKVIGMDPEVEAFDLDILLFVNTSLVDLRRMGIAGNSIQIINRSQLWSDFWPHASGLGMIQTYVYLSAKLAFDPPQMGFNIASLQERKRELEFQLKVLGEQINVPSIPGA